MGTGTMKCVKLGGLQYASKLLLELSNVKCKINSVPKIKPTIKASGRKTKQNTIECYKTSSLKLYSR